MSVKLPKYKSEAKNTLVRMLAQFKDSDEGDFVFYLRGNTEYADNYIHRMRVELSRFRAKIAKNKKAWKPFKILRVSVEEMPDGIVKVVLRKDLKDSRAINDVADVFELVDGVEKIDAR